MRVTLGLFLASALLALASLGCEEKAKKSAAEEGASSESESEPKVEPNPQTDLKATRRGEPVEILTANAYPTTDWRWDIGISTHARPCREPGVNGVAMEKGERYASVTLARMIDREDGSWAWRLTGSYFEGMTRMNVGLDLGSPPELSDDGDVLSVGFEPRLDIEAMRGDPSLFIEGTLRARVCPRYEVIPADAREAEGDLSLTIGGEAVPVRGARLEMDGDRRELILTNVPEACDADVMSVSPDVRIELELGEMDGTPEKAFVHGPFAPLQSTISGGLLDGLEVSVSGDGATREATVKGEVEFFGQPAVFAGSITATVCPEG